MKAKINFNFLLHLIRIVCLRTTFFFNSKSPTNKMENKNHEAHCEIYFEAFTRGNHSTWLCVYKTVLSIFIYIFQQKALEKIYQTTKHWNLCNAIILIILFHFFFLLSFLPFFYSLQEDQDWGFVAMVLDRLFLWLFTTASLFGTFSILCEAPALWVSTTLTDFISFLLHPCQWQFRASFLILQHFYFLSLSQK